MTAQNCFKLTANTSVKLVLPFKYCLQEIRKPVNAQCFKRVPIEHQELASNRLKYFARDTAQVMYERCAWLTWSGELVANQTFRSDEYPEVEIQMLRPQIALFEACRRDGQIDAESLVDARASSLQLGMLILEFKLARFVEGQDTLSSWLNFIEKVRFWQANFDKFEWPVGFEWGCTVTENLAKGGNKYGFDQWRSWLVQPLRISEALCVKLFPAEWDTSAIEFAAIVPDAPVVGLHIDQKFDSPRWSCYADNRAYVWQLLESTVGPELDFEKSTTVETLWWSKILNVDRVFSPPEASEFENQWTSERTYKRWLHYKSVYGFSYHSGVAWLSPSVNPDFSAHFRSLYFDMALLMLFIRVALFEFGSQVSALAIKRDNAERNRSYGASDAMKLTEDYQKLRKDFLLFSNLYQYPLVSNQQQAVEMYTLMRKHMDIDEMFKEIERDIQSTHEQFNLEATLVLTKRTAMLQNIATVFLPLSLFFAWFALDNKLEKAGDLRMLPYCLWSSNQCQSTDFFESALLGVVAAVILYVTLNFCDLRARFSRLFAWLRGWPKQ